MKGRLSAMDVQLELGSSLFITFHVLFDMFHSTGSIVGPSLFVRRGVNIP